MIRAPRSGTPTTGSTRSACGGPSITPLAYATALIAPRRVRGRRRIRPAGALRLALLPRRDAPRRGAARRADARPPPNDDPVRPHHRRHRWRRARCVPQRPDRAARALRGRAGGLGSGPLGGGHRPDRARGRGVRDDRGPPRRPPAREPRARPRTRGVGPACCSAPSCGKRSSWPASGRWPATQSRLRSCPGGAARCRRCSRSRRGWARSSCCSPRRGPSPAGRRRERLATNHPGCARRPAASSSRRPRSAWRSRGSSCSSSVASRSGRARVTRSCGSIRSSPRSRSWLAWRPRSSRSASTRCRSAPSDGSRRGAGTSSPCSACAAWPGGDRSARCRSSSSCSPRPSGRSQRCSWRASIRASTTPRGPASAPITAWRRATAGTWPGSPSSAPTASKRRRPGSSTRVPCTRTDRTIPTRSACSPSIRPHTRR